MKQISSLFLLVSTLISCNRFSEQEQLVFARMRYVYDLKSFIDENIWAGFNDKRFDVPLVYYADTCCYVANPTERFISLYNPHLVSRSKALTVYKTSLLDSIPFHMSVNIRLGDSTADYNYHSPFINSSSVEVTRQTIAGTGSTEEWATMVMHEYFHGFQFMHPTFFDYYEKNIVFTASQNSLKNLYKQNAWFKESVDKENDLLLAAIATTDEKEIGIFVDSFFQQRTNRRGLASSLQDFDIKPIEETYETLEGSARYVEFGLYSMFAKKQPDDDLLKTDSAYHSYSYFQKFKLEDNQWLYKTDRTTYFYATGFNMLRLLDKLGVEYKSRLFNESGLSIEQILSEYK